MSLKEKAQAMRVVTKLKWSQHGYETQQVISTLYGYIHELEVKLAEATKPAPRAAPVKKAPAPKAPAKKAPAKKKK